MAATACSSLSAIRVIGVGSSPLIPNHGNSSFCRGFNYHPQSNPNCRFQAFKCSSSLLGSFTSSKIHLPLVYATPPLKPAARTIPFALQDASMAASDFMNNVALADLDPGTAKLAIGLLGPFLSAFSFLFIARIVMSWYPKLPVGKFPYVIAYAPTEPLLIATRKVIPPLGGVDVTPVVWFGLVSFLNEILLGPQGLLVLLSQQVS
ncbi:protein COFACTOR ASSEMBLY OF COMPLEX C SUBUNIT B CCB3, chloroplastic isoform X1 [Cucurbita pepo subsp. pepo]|uniref:protein COFACTOR ASSEMBLY OF COMPLEX C SUBUNIT B CCB3, chloroplastic isoform X1 n=1 Tax=Cucurbita pepo subsp. pepo TaxID=3664 RepID=UPI000C9D2E61|nr:protein COFACTOR ASSEMBLY OF COMPLEX C SUBUNIT B CCB3, chloroplastic isoform X1 [Cucurbita pepo subsp. pepo]